MSPEEPVAPPPPIPPASSDSERSSKYAQRLNSTDGPSYVPDRKEPDGVCLCLTIVIKSETFLTVFYKDLFLRPLFDYFSILD